ncbi:hypothetical protein D3C75_1324310 [compost metagenome]
MDISTAIGDMAAVGVRASVSALNRLDAVTCGPFARQDPPVNMASYHPCVHELNEQA